MKKVLSDDYLEKIFSLYDDKLTRKILKKHKHITFGEFLKLRDKYIEDKYFYEDLIDLALTIGSGILAFMII